MRLWFRRGKIPNEVLVPEPGVVPRERLLGNKARGKTSPEDFLNFVKNVVISSSGKTPGTRCN